MTLNLERSRFTVNPIHSQETRPFSVDSLAQIVCTEEVMEICKATNSQIHTLQEPSVHTPTTEVFAATPDGNAWLYYGLRPRVNDGLSWKPDSVTQHRSYVESTDYCIRPAMEESTYWGDPRELLQHRRETKEADFIRDPFAALPFNDATPENLAAWAKQWNKIIQQPDLPYPGQFSTGRIPHLRRKILQGTQQLLRQNGWHELHAIPTWFQTATMYEHLGFEYLNTNDQKVVQEIRNALGGVTNEQASWVVVAQFWAKLAEKNQVQPENYLPTDAILRNEQGDIITYPLSPNYNLWMKKKTY